MSSIISPQIKIPPNELLESDNIDTDFIVIEEDEIPEHQKEKVKKIKGHKQIYELYERILYEKFTPEEQQSLKRIVRKEQLAKAAETNQGGYRSSTHNRNSSPGVEQTSEDN